MKIAIYMEGGGDGKNSKDDLRRGMDAFLIEIKDACRERKWHWKLVCCGSRNDAYKGFRNAQASGDAGIVVLLVDSEAAVQSPPAAHLSQQDGWKLQDSDDARIHLMVQTMETWIVADRGALSRYYGQGFQGNAIPDHLDLEAVGKNDIANGLSLATANTQKGEYHKIKHARQLLGLISPETVRKRCLHCEMLFDGLLGLIRQND